MCPIHLWILAQCKLFACLLNFLHHLFTSCSYLLFYDRHVRFMSSLFCVFCCGCKSAVVVLDFVHFSDKRLAEKNLSEIADFVSGGSQNLNTVS